MDGGRRRMAGGGMMNLRLGFKKCGRPLNGDYACSCESVLEGRRSCFIICCRLSSTLFAPILSASLVEVFEVVFFRDFSFTFLTRFSFHFAYLSTLKFSVT